MSIDWAAEAVYESVAKNAEFSMTDVVARSYVTRVAAAAMEMPTREQAIEFVRAKRNQLRRDCRRIEKRATAFHSFNAMNEVLDAVEKAAWKTYYPAPPAQRTLDDVLKSVIDLQRQVVAKAVDEAVAEAGVQKGLRHPIKKTIHRDERGRISHVIEEEL